MNNPFSGGSKQAYVDGDVTASGVADAIYAITKELTIGLIGRITVVGVDILGRTITVSNPFKLFVKSKEIYPDLTRCKGGGQKWVINAPQSRLDPINAQYGNPQISYMEDRTVPCPVLPPFFPAGTECHAKILVKDTAYFLFCR